MTDARRALGQDGEDQAAAWYRARGYAVLARNWRCRADGLVGELDLVVAKGRTLVFVEVKTRRTDRFGVPAEAVTAAKQRRVRALARAYLEANDVHPSALRFDVVSILAGRLEVIEAAF
jgi:putative endonuclease